MRCPRLLLNDLQSLYFFPFFFTIVSSGVIRFFYPLLFSQEHFWLIWTLLSMSKIGFQHQDQDQDRDCIILRDRDQDRDWVKQPYHYLDLTCPGLPSIPWPPGYGPPWGLGDRLGEHYNYSHCLTDTAKHTFSQFKPFIFSHFIQGQGLHLFIYIYKTCFIIF